MRKLIYIFIGIIFIIVSCSEKKVKQIPLIEGRITNYYEKDIFLFENGNNKIPLDTIIVNEEGYFSIPKESIKSTNFYYLQLNNKVRINLFLKTTDYINIQFDADNVNETLSSTNSNFMTKFWELERNNQLFNKEINKISSEVTQKLDEQELNDSLYESFSKRKDKLVNDFRKKNLKIVESTKNSVLDFVMLNQKAANVTLFDLKNDLDRFLKNAEDLIKDEELKRIFDSYDKEIMTAYSLIRAGEHYNIGGEFPKLKARTNWNETVDLEQLKGKPTHIIFWSGIDLLEDDKLKQVKRMMYRYGKRGLKTMMVAYTNDKEQWLKNIKRYKLPYWHLIDTVSVESTDLIEMGVRYLPCNFIVDSTGVIIQRNIWGNDLEKAINNYVRK